MRVGVSLSDPGTVVADARRAEAAGFDLVAVGEHVFHHGPVPNPYVQLAAAAAATERVRLLSSITLIPLYPPALAAKQAATLDIVSRGRFDMGIGAGGEFPNEFRAVGVDPRTRFRRLDEGLEVLRLLFSGRPATFEGEFTTLRGEQLNPPPVQRGGPPIWLGGRRGSALRRVGRFASVWLPYMISPDGLAQGFAQVRIEAERCERDDATIGAALFAFACVDDDADWARRTGIATVSQTYQQDFTSLADKYLLLGSPEQVTDRLLEYRDAGVETVVLQLAAAPDARHQVLTAISEQVLPRIT